MLRKTATTTAIACATMFVSAIAHADGDAASPISGNLTFTTNYVVRGLSQTNFKPAVQGTMEYAHSSGLYVGLFASNVSWYGDAWEVAGPGTNGNIYGGAANTAISNNLETDLYAGFRGSAMEHLGYDVGAVYYYYPGKYYIEPSQAAFGMKKPNTAEIYGSVGWDWISAKLSYAVTDGVFGVSDARGSYYGELNANYGLGDSGITLVGHAGFWRFSGKMLIWQQNGLKNDVYNFVDYKIGATADYAGLTWGLFFWGSTADKNHAVSVTQTDPIAVWGNRFGKNVGDSSVFLTATKAF
ncbi:MAG: hypothetical protein GC151_19545 [Betaproteobacteria bacterium]|nr:hypothetical protein [Betaproteobacteria bacterium]